ncbi:co-chaperone GroES [Pseudodesulfovibrio sp. zrk46]|uniref:co-chaperone GroES n=1 Tax=Pseudodesulfovibrio sp. zrk46 TaxID=2725288 RepID=UPI00144955B3|nr:co-chaperone GroES [Pseudodesulfovibrio sp. zrk46]QJB55122.1 co-chaperone GroES [Pseudodesulfovibrio sp. zrk46]
MKLKPLNDRVLVKRLEMEEKTAGGIYIPDSAKEKPMKGEIVAAGPGKLDDKGERVAMTVKVGDTVLFAKYAGSEITIDGEETLVMREDDILAIVD